MIPFLLVHCKSIDWQVRFFKEKCLKVVLVISSFLLVIYLIIYKKYTRVTSLQSISNYLLFPWFFPDKPCIYLDNLQALTARAKNCPCNFLSMRAPKGRAKFLEKYFKITNYYYNKFTDSIPFSLIWNGM